MKNSLFKLIITITCATFILCGCNESGKIWTKYSKESFCTMVRYRQFDTEIYAKITVERGEADRITAEFSSPEALRGAVAVFDGNEFILTCEGIELHGEVAKKLLNIPLMLATKDAISFVKLTENECRYLEAKTENGKIIFDIDTGEPVCARLDGISCDIIDFYWRDQAT